MSTTGENPPVNDDKTQIIISYCREAHSIREIAKMLGYKDKKTVRKYLDPLLDDGRIAMTIPDKPNSRNQKYITVIEI